MLDDLFECFRVSKLGCFKECLERVRILQCCLILITFLIQHILLCLFREQRSSLLRLRFQSRICICWPLSLRKLPIVLHSTLHHRQYVLTAAYCLFIIVPEEVDVLVVHRIDRLLSLGHTCKLRTVRLVLLWPGIHAGIDPWPFVVIGVALAEDLVHQVLVPRSNFLKRLLACKRWRLLDGPVDVLNFFVSIRLQVLHVVDLCYATSNTYGYHVITTRNSVTSLSPLTFLDLVTFLFLLSTDRFGWWHATLSFAESIRIFGHVLGLFCLIGDVLADDLVEAKSIPLRHRHITLNWGQKITNVCLDLREAKLYLLLHKQLVCSRKFRLLIFAFVFCPSTHLR